MFSINYSERIVLKFALNNYIDSLQYEACDSENTVYENNARSALNKVILFKQGPVDLTNIDAAVILDALDHYLDTLDEELSSVMLAPQVRSQFEVQKRVAGSLRQRLYSAAKPGLCGK